MSPGHRIVDSGDLDLPGNAKLKSRPKEYKHLG
jgi:hypothetical protein